MHTYEMYIDVYTCVTCVNRFIYLFIYLFYIYICVCVCVYIYMYTYFASAFTECTIPLIHTRSPGHTLSTKSSVNSTSTI